MYNRYIVVGMVQTNCYVVAADDSDTCVVIDPGDDAGRIEELVKESGKKLAAILLTHGHFDHIYAVCELKNMYGGDVRIYASEKEKELLNTPRLNCSAMVGDPAKVVADVYVNDGDEIHEAGLTFKVLETPGHTAGSVCFYVEDENVLYSGDTLFEMSVGRTDLPTGSTGVLQRSLRDVVFKLPDEVVVYPGHGAQTDIAFEKRNNPWS